MTKKILLLFLILNLSLFANNLINKKGQTIKSRFLPPKGYHRIKVKKKSFAHFLRNLPLKPHNSLVKYFDGQVKENTNIYDAVIDLPIGNKDLHQCADAIIRLRAEYLWKNKRFKDIHFNFTNGFRVDYSKWMQGKRIIIKGNKTSWNNRNAFSNTYQDFWEYLELIFMYAGTFSLSKEMKKVDIKNMQIGDVFIWGGRPGHSVIVVDMAENKKGKKIFMLAQSYMPAQETQILRNPSDLKLSPWYQIDIKDKLLTPEWIFSKNALKRF